MLEYIVPEVEEVGRDLIVCSRNIAHVFSKKHEDVMDLIKKTSQHDERVVFEDLVYLKNKEIRPVLILPYISLFAFLEQFSKEAIYRYAVIGYEKDFKLMDRLRRKENDIVGLECENFHLNQELQGYKNHFEKLTKLSD